LYGKYTRALIFQNVFLVAGGRGVFAQNTVRLNTKAGVVVRTSAQALLVCMYVIIIIIIIIIIMIILFIHTYIHTYTYT